MRKNEKIREIFEDIKIPQELLPENIAIMLRESQKSKSYIQKAQNISSVKSISKSDKKINVTTNTSLKSNLVFSRKNKKKHMRAIATVAACLLVIVGLTVFLKNGKGGTQIPTQIDGNNQIVTSKSGSYQDIYNTFKKVYVTDKTQSELETIIKQADKETSEESICVLSKSYNAESVLNVDNVSSLIAKQQPYLTPATLLNDGQNIYCIADNSIFFIDSTDGNLTLLKKLQKENVTPVGMFLKDSKLVVLSEIITTEKKPTVCEPQETTSNTGKNQTDESKTDTQPLESNGSTITEKETETIEETTSQKESSTVQTQKTVEQTKDENAVIVNGAISQKQTTKITTSVVDNSSCEKITNKTVQVQVYDVTDPSNPTLLNEIKQDGRYISAIMNVDNIYIASGYNDNKNNVIKSEEDIDKYVPSYIVNGNRNYIPAENIFSTENVINTNYLVVMGIDIISVSPVKTATAMLGFDDNIYFSNGNVYAYVNEYGEKTQNAIILKMTASDGVLSEPHSIKINGIIKNINCINDKDGYLKVVSSIYNNEDATFSNGIYIFSEDLKQVGSLKGFGGKAIIKNVSFEDTTVYCQTNDEQKTVIAIDCSDPSTPLVFNDSDIKGAVPMVYNIGNDKYLAVGIINDENEIAKGIEVSIYQNDTDSKEFVQKASLELPETSIESDLDLKIIPKVIYVNKEKSEIGISVTYNDGIDICNKFYMAQYSNDKIELVGQPIEYHDVSNIYQFNSTFTIGDYLYIVSTGRIVCVDGNTMKLLGKMPLVVPSIK